jgi:DNA polymerase V
MLKIYSLDVNDKDFALPIFSSRIPAGFPSPADDHKEDVLGLNAFLVKNPLSTFLAKTEGDSMKNIGIFDGDILVIDRSIEPADNHIIIGVVNGEFTVKRVKKRNQQLFLVPENEQYTEIEITEFTDFRIWGVVTFVIHKVLH